MKHLFDPASRQFAWTPVGRAGPLPADKRIKTDPEIYEDFKWLLFILSPLGLLGIINERWLRTVFTAVYDMLAVILSGTWIGLIAVFSTYLALRIYGYAMWTIRRLHDLDHPAWRAWPVLTYQIVLVAPPVAGIVIALSNPELDLVSAITVGGGIGFILLSGPIYIAFWRPFLADWCRDVIDQPGQPHDNRYGPPPRTCSAIA